MIKSIVIAALLLSVTAAMGQERARVGACAADIKEKCAGVERGEGRISASASRVSGWVVPTDEERMIARHTASVLELARSPVHV